MAEFGRMPATLPAIMPAVVPDRYPVPAPVPATPSNVKTVVFGPQNIIVDGDVAPGDTIRLHLLRDTTASDYTYEFVVDTGLGTSNIEVIPASSAPSDCAAAFAMESDTWSGYGTDQAVTVAYDGDVTVTLTPNAGWEWVKYSDSDETDTRITIT